ncbi:glycosyltransferase [Motilibacter aurantiacus]|uniref:glycosyltransferase n=1 Tax=Motilibacter aurantiacus TaxID=2714955 RepID=UPI00140AA708|nr:glycosyltransferase [Motilibacter aurantiacus]NHC46354.1 glycosyltransferase [Motilibacter aurantiacus]
MSSGAERPALVLASNVGGGIARHLQITGLFVPLEVVELPESLALPEKVRRARRELAQRGAPVVVTHGVAAALAVRLRGRALRHVAHVEFWHGDPFFGSPRRRAAYEALSRVGRSPSTQVFTHEWLAEEYAEAGALRVVLPNAVPDPGLPPVSPPGEGARRAVFLGRLSAEKGYTDLLAAWPADSADRGWSLEVLGEGPLATLAVPPGVTLRGNIAEPLAELAAADVVVIPSWTETGPYVALEAAAVGRPIIATRVGDMPAMVDGSGCGWLVAARDVPALEAALRQAQEAPRAELDDRGERGRAWLARERPIERWAERVRGLYAERGPARPTVAVVVPTLGQRPDYLARTLASLAAQDEVELRVTVVAPADAHAAAEQATSAGFEFLAQTGRGMSQAINQGWREGAGSDAEFWGWLGDDDLLTPGSLRAATAALRARPRASFVFGRCDYIDEAGEVLFEARPGPLAGRLLRWGPDLVPQPGSLARAEAVRRVGWIDESLRYAMDLDLFLRLKDVGPVAYVPRVLAAFRWHSGSTTVAGQDASAAEAREVRRRTWTGRRRLGTVLEPLAMQAGRVLHKAQRRSG